MYTNDEHGHQDLFQEMSIQLWKAYPRFRGEAKFSTWMYRVALNTAITLYRKGKKRADTGNLENVAFKVEAEEYDPTTEENINLMYKAIKELNDIDKALVLLYLDDKDYPEIAKTLGMSQVNARVKMNRVKKKIKKILQA
jgi:RNA polymerase sigma-70 factor (ECF subfamily)